MSKRKTPKPTEAELAILRVLWRRGASTVREVLDELQQRGTGYTTTLKLMQIMLEKGLLRRDESRRTHVYEAAVSRLKTQRQMVHEILDQVFDGSARQLVMQALSTERATREELADIRKLLDQLEGDAR